MNVSSSVGLAIFMQFALYYFLVICRYLSQLAMRLWDRGCKLGLAGPIEGKDEANEDDEEEEELARSKQMTQAQVKKLYTGDKFDAAFVQSQVMTVLSICIMFCGSMPLLYPAALLFLGFFFWFNKFILLKSNQRHGDYNERLIIISYKLLVLPIAAHLFLTMYMLRLSPMLRFFKYPSGNYESSEDWSAHQAHLIAIPKEMQSYVDFISLVFVLYGFNLFVINPITCFFQEGCCFVVK